MSLEQAASAFDIAIGNSEPAARSSRSENSNSRPAEQMFGNLGALEVDDESPLEGGGDNLRVEGEVPPRRRTPKEPVELDEEDQLPEEIDGEAQEGDEDADPDADPDAEDEEGKEGDDDLYEVVIDGEKREVPLREALNGYIRQETFHQRLNQLNEVKQAIRGEAELVLADRQKYVSKIDELDKHIELLLPKEPDWDAEYAANPKAARELQKKYEQFSEARNALRAEKARELKDQEDAVAKETRNFTAAENAKIQRNNPTWIDPKVMQRDLNMMAETAEKAGFSIEEVKSIKDSRMVTVLLKAAKWDKLQGNRPQPVRRGARPAKPGAGSTRTAPNGSKAMKQLSRTGSVDDAAAVFSGIINPKTRR